MLRSKKRSSMSTKPYEKSLFVFRRDLRLQDNTGLVAALKKSKSVTTCFIFDPRQIGSGNKFRSQNAIQFMVKSLQDLAKQLKNKNGKLYLFKGHAEVVVKRLIKQENFDALFLNRDYTPFSLKRDKAIAKLCRQHDIDYCQYNDLLLSEPEEILTGKNTPYSIFSAFYKNASRHQVTKPHTIRTAHFAIKKITGELSFTIFKQLVKKENKKLHVHGGTTAGNKILGSLKQYKHYTETRDIPALSTTNLSAYLKFGCVSIRQTFYAIQKQLGMRHPLLRQLYWRDFFTHVAYHSPFVFGQPYHAKYKNLWWSKSKTHFDAWCTGKTGFPIVDAGMRQLNTTGFMHNRVRMIVASFLTKDLHINWLWGEKYFAQQLVDYDPAVNNGNWQWSASTGCDAQPYFRIFNPWLQQKKFDKDCTYIQRWIPELKDIPTKVIHTWYQEKHLAIKQYPRPIVDHAIESKKAKLLYKKVKS